MALVDILTALVTVLGPIMNLNFLPQAHRIIKRKSSMDISMAAYLIMLPGFASWLGYGIVKNDFPLIVSNMVGLAGNILVLAVTLIYRKGK